MDWGNVFVDAGNEADKYLEQQRANQAITSIVEQLVQGSGIQDLDPNSADFGQQAVARQGGAAQAALRALGGNQDIGSIGPAQLVGLTNTLGKTALAPQEYQMKRFEDRQNTAARIAEEKAKQLAIKEAEHGYKMKEIEQRNYKMQYLKNAVAQGLITPEQYEQAVQVELKLQPQPQTRDTMPKWTDWGHGQKKDLNPMSPTYGKLEKVPTAPLASEKPERYTMASRIDDTRALYQARKSHMINPLTGGVFPEFRNEFKQIDQMMMDDVNKIRTGSMASWEQGKSEGGQPLGNIPAQATPQQAPPAARQQAPQQGRPPITEADIQFTAKKYGMTRAQVLKKLGLQ